VWVEESKKHVPGEVGGLLLGTVCEGRGGDDGSDDDGIHELDHFDLRMCGVRKR